MIDFSKFNLEGEIKALQASLAQADDHPAIDVADSIVMAGEAFLTRLMEIRLTRQTDECDDLIASTIDGLSDVVGRATRKEEDDRCRASRPAHPRRPRAGSLCRPALRC